MRHEKLSHLLVMTWLIALSWASLGQIAFAGYVGSWPPIRTSAVITRALTMQQTGTPMDFPFDVDFCSTSERLNTMLKFQQSALKVIPKSDPAVFGISDPGLSFFSGKVCKPVSSDYLRIWSYATGKIWIRHATLLNVDCEKLRAVLIALTVNEDSRSAVAKELQTSMVAYAWLNGQAVRQPEGWYKGGSITKSITQDFWFWADVNNIELICSASFYDRYNYLDVGIDLKPN